jgi:hypothetical protein
VDDRDPRTTWAAIGLAVAITIPYLVILVQTIRQIADPDLLSEEALRALVGLGGSPGGDDFGIALTIVAIVIGAVSGLVILVIIGLVGRRQWAREAGFAVFATLGLVSGALGISGMLSTPRPSGAWLGAATGLACASVVVLLMLESTGIEFELADMERRKKRATAPQSPDTAES